MAISVNKVILAGHLGADPEQSSDRAPVKFSVATSKKIKSGDDWIDKTEWHKVVVWNPRAQTYAMKYLKKGDMVYIEGTMEYRVWEKDGGERVHLAEVIVPPFEGVLQGQSRSSGGGRQSDPDQEESGRGTRRQSDGDFGQSRGGGGGFSRDLDDEIPFEMSWR